MTSLGIHLFGLLCALGSAALAPAAAIRGSVGRWREGHSGWLLMAAGFVAGAWWTALEQVPHPVFAGFGIALVAALQLVRPGFFPLAAVSSGVLSAVWIPILRLQEVAFVPASVLAVAVPLVSLLLASRGTAFAPLPVHEGAILLVAALGLAVAAAPGISDGWRAAGVMNLDYEPSRGPGQTVWLYAAGLGSLVLGGGYSLWFRNR